MFAIFGIMITGCDLSEQYDSECVSTTDYNGDVITKCKDLNAVYENYDDVAILIFNDGDTATVYDLESDTSTKIEITRDI